MDFLNDLLKNWKDWMEFIFPLMIFLTLYIFRYIRQFAKTKHLRDIAPLLNSEVVSGLFSPPRLKGMYMGTPFQMLFLPPSRSAPGGLMQIKLEFLFYFILEVVPKGQRQGLEELFVKGKALSSGEESFDDVVLAKADKEREKAMLFLDNPWNREVILKLFETGFVSLQFKEKEAVLTKPGDFLGKTPLTAEKALEDLDLAVRLVQKI